MTLAADIIAAHAEHPLWSQMQIARYTGAAVSTVRWVANQNRLTIKHGHLPKKALHVKPKFKRASFAGKDPRGGDQW